MPLAPQSAALPEDIDVVIVGAGLAGLACARALARSGAKAAVLEARDRVGGRTLSQPIGRGVFDLGGQWLGARQPRLARLTEELALETFPTFDEGRKVLDLRGSISTYEGTIPRIAPWRLAELHRAMRSIEAQSQEVPLDDPTRAARAGALDSTTLEEWKRRSVHSRAVRSLLDASVRVVFGAEPREISMLYFLYYLRSGGGLMSLIDIKNGAQQTRFVQGAQAVAQGLAERLEAPVHLGAPVRHIAQDGEGVRVHVARHVVRARYAVVAVPPALAGRLSYAPGLPAARDMLTQRFPMGATVKCIALYSRAFWRDRGFSGEAVSEAGPITVTFDNTSHDGAQPSLLAFVVGDAARTWHRRDEREREAEVLRAFARYFGDEALRPEAYLEQDWSSEVFTRGCPVGVLPPGALSVAGNALREPVGRIHWAGTETAREWTGYMEGALESGERAAAEIIGKL
jgi:monoamine oxidase